MHIIKRSLSSIVMITLELLVGVLLLINPVGLTTGIIVCCGVVLMLWGAGCIVKYFRADPEEAAEDHTLVRGVLLFLGGMFCAFRSYWFAATFPVLTLLYGVVILIGGIIKLQWMLDIIRLKRRRWLPAALSALVSITCGALVIADPFGTTAVLWMFTGVSLLVEAALDLIAMLFGNRATRRTVQSEENNEGV